MFGNHYITKSNPHPYLKWRGDAMRLLWPKVPAECKQEIAGIYRGVRARMGHPCGDPFYAKPSLKDHPEFAWQRSVLGDTPTEPWTLFTAHR